MRNHLRSVTERQLNVNCHVLFRLMSDGGREDLAMGKGVQLREHTRKEEQEEKTAGEDRQGLCRVSVPMGQPPWPDTVGSDWPQKAPGAGQSQVPQPHWRCLWKNVFKKR